MFDQLIESDTIGADFKSRRRYFLVSSVVVGALFLSAVVFSIYASDIGLGNDSYELTALLTPVQPPAEAPEPPQPRPERQSASTQNSNDIPSRVIKQAPVDVLTKETPPVSTIQNKYLSIPNLPSRIGPTDTLGSAQSKGDVPGTGSEQVTKEAENPAVKSLSFKSDPPPPIEKPQPPRSIGVVNGIAKSLPKPPYPAAAASLGIQGKVDVQVTIDEEGNVISAKAASGHIMLRDAAVNAALKAKFTPTYLSRVPVKVTGVIIYNFTRN